MEIIGDKMEPSADGKKLRLNQGGAWAEISAGEHEAILIKRTDHRTSVNKNNPLNPAPIEIDGYPKVTTHMIWGMHIAQQTADAMTWTGGVIPTSKEGREYRVDNTSGDYDRMDGIVTHHIDNNITLEIVESYTLQAVDTTDAGQQAWELGGGATTATLTTIAFNPPPPPPATDFPWVWVAVAITVIAVVAVLLLLYMRSGHTAPAAGPAAAPVPTVTAVTPGATT